MHRRLTLNRGRRIASGSSLVAVLVVLAIVGMLAAHTFRTLLLLRQRDSSRAAMRQNQAIIDFARHVAESTTVQSLESNTHDCIIEVLEGSSAAVSIQLAEKDDINGLRDYRIVIQPPQPMNANSHNPGMQTGTFSWQSAGWDESRLNSTPTIDQETEQ